MCVTDEFRGLSKDQLVRLLRSEELRIEDEYQVFTAAMDWVLQDVAKRKKHVVEVLEPVRFPLLSPQRLFKYIEGKESKHFSTLLSYFTYFMIYSHSSVVKMIRWHIVNNILNFSIKVLQISACGWHCRLCWRNTLKSQSLQKKIRCTVSCNQPRWDPEEKPGNTSMP